MEVSPQGPDQQFIGFSMNSQLFQDRISSEARAQPSGHSQSKCLSSRSLIELQTTNRSPANKSINQIRSQTFKFKFEIMAFKARLSSIEHQNTDNTKRLEWAKQKTQAINSTKDRILTQRKQKQELKEYRTQQAQYLKRKVQDWREFCKTRRQMTKESLSQEKLCVGDSMRRETSRDQQDQFFRNRSRADSMKKSHNHIMNGLREREGQKAQEVSLNRHRKYSLAVEQNSKYNKLINKLKQRERRKLKELGNQEQKALRQIDVLRSTIQAKHPRKSVYEDTIQSILTKTQRSNSRRFSSNV